MYKLLEPVRRLETIRRQRGWLYWRKGLIAAMVSHAVFDIVTKVIVPLLTGG